MLLCISITALVRSSKDHFCWDSERNEIWWKFYQIWAFHALLIIYVIVGQKKNPCRTWPGNIILKTREMCDGNAYTCQVLISILYKTTIMRPIASMRSGSWTRQVISVMQSSLMTTSIETNKAYTWLCCLWTYLGLPVCCSLCYLKNHRLLPDHGWPDPLYVKLPWFGPLVHMHSYIEHCLAPWLYSSIVWGNIVQLLWLCNKPCIYGASVYIWLWVVDWAKFAYQLNTGPRLPSNKPCTG